MLPKVLLAPCLLPEFDVKTYGDYPDYVERIRLTVEKCNYNLEMALELQDKLENKVK